MAEKEKMNYVPLSRARSSLKIVDRQGWGAQPPADVVEQLGAVPPEYVIVHFANVEPCKDELSCSRLVQDLQRQQMKEGYDDIKWNFLIGGNGRVYEGRGWNHNAAREADHYEYNGKAIDIAFLCRPGEKNVSRHMENGLEALIRRGIIEVNLQRFYTIIGFKEQDHFVYVDEGMYTGFEAYIV